MIFCQGCNTNISGSTSDSGYFPELKQEETGIVRYVNKDCYSLIITFAKGKYYIVCEDKNNQFEPGDIVSGNFYLLGQQKIFNKAKSKEYSLYIEKRFSDKNLAFQSIENKCGVTLPSSFIFHE